MNLHKNQLKIILFYLLIFCASANAAVWRSIDESGAVTFSNSRLQTDAELVISSDKKTRPEPKALYSTYCPPTCKQPTPNWWLKSEKYLAVEGYLASAARVNGIEAALLESIAATESAFEVDVVSSKGAVGVMQVMPKTARQYGVNGPRLKDIEMLLKNPSINISVAAKHLSRLNKKYDGRLDLMLAAYNAGEAAVSQAANQVPHFGETKRYVANVLYLYLMAKR